MQSQSEYMHLVGQRIAAFPTFDFDDNATFSVRTPFGHHEISQGLYRKLARIETEAFLGGERAQKVLRRYNRKVRNHMGKRWERREI